eukprot:COSAG06_NODE_15179_length_1091_cov_36.898185_1_plen_106_part_10
MEWEADEDEDDESSGDSPSLWRGGESKFEDALLEAFVLFCSNRFITWGSVHQAKMHVVEFMRWTTGVTPPTFHNRHRRCRWVAHGQAARRLSRRAHGGLARRSLSV